MIRTDGTYKIFIIEFLQESDKTWHYAGDGDHWLTGTLPFDKEPRKSFNACGNCWQQTGVFGTFDKKTAFDLLYIISENNKTRSFRVCELYISQKITPLITMGKL
jgi:hypothetical protein